MTESLIVNDSEEDFGLHLDAIRAGIHRLRTVVVVAGDFLKNNVFLKYDYEIFFSIFFNMQVNKVQGKLLNVIIDQIVRD